MMVSITDIQAIDGHAGMTAAEVAAALNANPRHHRDAYITGGPGTTAAVNILHLLTARFKVMRQNRSQEWVGPLVDLAESNPQVDAILGLLYPHLQVKDSIVYCSASEEAAGMVNGLTAAVGSILEASENGTTADVVSAVAQLTGGRKFGNVTAEQVAAARTEHAETETLRIRSGWINDAIQSDAAQAVLRDSTKTMAETQTAVSDAIEAAWGGE